jgi:hypothetical protein
VDLSTLEQQHVYTELVAAVRLLQLHSYTSWHLRFGMTTVLPPIDAQENLPQPKHGFIIYQMDHSDELRRKQFMRYLNVQVYARMWSQGMAYKILNMDWKVQNSPELENVSFEEVGKQY